MDVEQLVEWELAEETEMPGENIPLLCFVHPKIYMTWDETRTAAVGIRQITS
jgi:hypothetical protein